MKNVCKMSKKNTQHINHVRPIQWQHIIEMAVFLFAILATTISLNLHMDSKVEQHRLETQSILNGIREEVRGIHVEMRDFHGKLERQDAEYKAHMMHLHHKE